MNKEEMSAENIFQYKYYILLYINFDTKATSNTEYGIRLKL